MADLDQNPQKKVATVVAAESTENQRRQHTIQIISEVLDELFSYNHWPINNDNNNNCNNNNNTPTPTPKPTVSKQPIVFQFGEVNDGRGGASLDDGAKSGGAAEGVTTFTEGVTTITVGPFLHLNCSGKDKKNDKEDMISRDPGDVSRDPGDDFANDGNDRRSERARYLTDRLAIGLCDVWSQIRGDSAKQITKKMESLARDLNHVNYATPLNTAEVGTESGTETEAGAGAKRISHSHSHSHCLRSVGLVVEALLSLLTERANRVQSPSERSWQVSF